MLIMGPELNPPAKQSLSSYINFAETWKSNVLQTGLGCVLAKQKGRRTIKSAMAKRPLATNRQNNYASNSIYKVKVDLNQQPESTNLTRFNGNRKNATVSSI